MSTKENPEAAIDTSRLLAELDALQPNVQQRKEALFQQLYPGVERAIKRKVSQKEIVAKLETMGLRLSMGGFRALLEAERKQRAETGDMLRCQHCNSIMHDAVDVAVS